MRQLILILALTSALAASHAQAAGAKKEGEGEKVGQYVDIAPLAMPIVADGRLVNYVFVTVRLNLASGADASKMREKEPFLRDALVRAAHRTPFTLRTDYFHVDEAALKGAVARDVAPLIGARNVVSVQILNQQAKQRTGVPRAPAA